MAFGREETERDLHFRNIAPEARWREDSCKIYFTALEAQFKQILFKHLMARQDNRGRKCILPYAFLCMWERNPEKMVWFLSP